MGKSLCCEKVGLKKGPWTAEEDQKLLAYIEEHGHGSWRALPEAAGNYINISITLHACMPCIEKIYRIELQICMETLVILTDSIDVHPQHES